MSFCRVFVSFAYFSTLEIPTYRVFINISSSYLVIVSVSDYMLGTGALKHFFDAEFLLTSTCGQGLKRTNNIIERRRRACSSRKRTAGRGQPSLRRSFIFSTKESNVRKNEKSHTVGTDLKGCPLLSRLATAEFQRNG